jgi:hypothetical protein
MSAKSVKLEEMSFICQNLDFYEFIEHYVELNLPNARYGNNKWGIVVPRQGQ